MLGIDELIEIIFEYLNTISLCRPRTNVTAFVPTKMSPNFQALATDLVIILPKMGCCAIYRKTKKEKTEELSFTLNFKRQ